MKHTIRIFILALCAVLPFAQLRAEDDVQFRAQAPAQVIAGKPFQLTYTVNQRAKDLRAPEFTDFDYLAGPYTSQSSSTSFVNGKRTSSFSLTYTYTLMANKEGTFTLQPATIRVGGDTYTSNGVRITVLPPDQEPANTTSNGNQHVEDTAHLSAVLYAEDSLELRGVDGDVATALGEEQGAIEDGGLVVATVVVLQFGLDFAQFDLLFEETLELGQNGCFTANLPGCSESSPARWLISLKRTQSKLF